MVYVQMLILFVKKIIIIGEGEIINSNGSTNEHFTSVPNEI